MPWKVSGVVEKRRVFVEQWLTENWTMTELCARYGISRQAGYNTVAMYQREMNKPRRGERRVLAHTLQPCGTGFNLHKAPQVCGKTRCCPWFN